MCCNAITLNLCISGCQLPLHSLCGTRPQIPTIPSLFICVGPPECFVHTKLGCTQCTHIPKLKSSHKLKGYASSQCKFQVYCHNRCSISKTKKHFHATLKDDDGEAQLSDQKFGFVVLNMFVYLNVFVVHNGSLDDGVSRTSNLSGEVEQHYLKFQ